MFATMKQLNNLIDILCSARGLYGLFSVPFFGKTSLVMYMAARLSRKGCKALVISLELSKEQWLERTGEMMSYDENHLTVLDHVEITFDEIRNVIIREKPLMVFIAYLELLDLDDRCDCVIDLKNMSKELAVPIVITGKLPRSSGDYDCFDRRPELYDLCSTLGFKPNTTFKLVRKAISSFDVILFLHRHHDCERNIGTAHRYNVSETAELIIKQSPFSPLLAECELPERCVFDLGYRNYRKLL